jgi:sec-independent protein translocase protein TatC
MSVPDNKKGGTPEESTTVSETQAAAPEETGTDASNVSYGQTTDSDYDSHYRADDYHQNGSYPPSPAVTESAASKALSPVTTGGSGSAKPPTPPADEEDDEEEGMARMSFLEHLEELRSRIIKILIGLAIAFAITVTFSNQLWKAISEPAVSALKALGYPPELIQLTPMDAFLIIWMKVPLLASIFLASPWIIWQIWSFVAPGLYKRERRFAAPLIISSAALFIMGGLFAYFVAFRFGLEFLLGIGKDINVRPAINMVDYFDLFVNVTLGIGVVFEMPIVIFFLALLRIVSARFLVEHTRYAILIIVVVAAVITPTPDVFNLMLFSVPMLLLYFVGVFSAYLLELRRDQKSFPWASVLVIVLAISAVAGAIVWALVARYGYKFTPAWPFLSR